MATLDHEPFAPLRWLLTQCWLVKPELRPSTRDIIPILSQAAEQLGSGGWSSAGTSPSLSSAGSPPLHPYQSFSSSSMSLDSMPRVFRGTLKFTQFDALQQPRECQVHTTVKCTTESLQFPLVWPTALTIHPTNYKYIPVDGISEVLPSRHCPVFSIEVDMQYDLLDPYDSTAETGPIHFWELWDTLAKNGTYAESYVDMGGPKRYISTFIIYSVASPTTKKKWLEAAYFQCTPSTAPSTPEAHRPGRWSPVQPRRIKRGESWSC